MGKIEKSLKFKSFSEKQSNNKIQNYEMKKVIGTGTFGKVREAIHTPTNQKVAIKILQKKKIIDRKDLQRIQRQLIILKEIDHKNILKLKELYQTSQRIYIVTQLVQGQQLYERIIKKKKLSIEQSCQYFVQLVNAIEYLHQKKICHRDIKPENIIVDVQNKKLKLIDFGLSNKFDQNFLMKTSCGSPCYAAPQMLTGKKYDPIKTDIWAMGVTLYAMLAGQLPFQHQNTDKLYKLIKNGQYEQIGSLPTYLKLLIRSMIQPDPNLRTSMDEIKQNIWIRDKLKDQQNQRKCSHQKFNKLLYQTHQGGFHLKYVFKDVQAINLFLNKKNKQIVQIYMQKYVQGHNQLDHFNEKLTVMEMQSDRKTVKIIKKTIAVAQKLDQFDLSPQNILKILNTSENKKEEEVSFLKIKKLKNMPKLLYFPFEVKHQIA